MPAAILQLAARSVWNRRATAALTIFAIAVSVTLLLGVEKLRHEARASFASTISGTDLIVGARSGALQMLLYSVFRMGDPTNNIEWESYEQFAGRADVAWTIPISLGDSHRGYRVLGTTDAYFEHFRYGRRQALQMADGRRFDGVYEAVLGAEVAAALDYAVGDPIVIAHGIGTTSFAEHADAPFTVAGVLRATGTPVDRTVHVPLGAIDAIHADWAGGASVGGGFAAGSAKADGAAGGRDDHGGHEHEPDHAGGHEHGPDHAGGHEHGPDHAGGHEHEPDHAGGHEHEPDHEAEHEHGQGHEDQPEQEHGEEQEHQPVHRQGEGHEHEHEHEHESITAFFVGMESRVDTLRLQRQVNEYEGEALTAVIPGVALQQLWGLVGVAETALLAVSVLVVLSGLLGMMTAILTSLAERRREMAILRSVGARPWHVFALMIAEAGLLALGGALAGVVLTYGALALAAPVIESRLGLYLGIPTPGGYDMLVVLLVVVAAVGVGALPAWRAYRNSLADGLTIRL